MVATHLAVVLHGSSGCWMLAEPHLLHKGPKSLISKILTAGLSDRLFLGETPLSQP